MGLYPSLCKTCNSFNNADIQNIYRKSKEISKWRKCNGCEIDTL